MKPMATFGGVAAMFAATLVCAHAAGLERLKYNNRGLVYKTLGRHVEALADFGTMSR